MAITVISAPAGLCLSGNLPKLSIGSAEDVRIRLLDGERTVLDETYTPDFTGAITLDLAEPVNDALSFTLPGSDVFIQPALVKIFTLLLNDEASDFTAIRAGVKDLSGTPEDFLMQNFLTAQEQFKKVTAGQPEWLTCYATRACYFYITAYPLQYPAEHICLAALEPGQACSVNMQFDRLAALCNHRPETIAAYLVDTDSPAGQRLSYIQYYRHIPDMPYQRYYCFENSLGGLDTVRCTGEAKAVPEYMPATAVINDRESAYRIDKKDIKTQNTGWLSKAAALWLQDMFASRKTYILENDRWTPIILDENPNAEKSTHEDLTAFEFTFRPATETPYLAIHRIEETISATFGNFINCWQYTVPVVSAAWGGFINRWQFTQPVAAGTWGDFINKWSKVANDYSFDYSRDYNRNSPLPPYLNVAPATVWLPRGAPEAQVQVNSNQDWTIE